MRRLLAVCLMISMLFTLCACSSKTDINSVSENRSEGYETVLSTESSMHETKETDKESDDVSIEGTKSDSSFAEETKEPVQAPTSPKEDDASGDDTTISATKPSTTEKEEQNSNDPSEETEEINPEVIYKTFDKPLNKFLHKNIQTESGEYIAFMDVFMIDDKSNEDGLKSKFKEAFGFEPTGAILKEYQGEYIVSEHTTPQHIYRYTISDSTYPLLEDDFYIITRKICADGSPWVGFSVPGNLDTMDTSSKVSKLLSEMNQLFYEWSGYDASYVASNDDKFMVNMISVAGWMRTKDGRVVEVVYRYTRGINIPII